MTGKVFTKLFLSFVLVLAIGTAILDFSLERVVADSLRQQLAQSLAGKARLLASEADVSKPQELKQLAVQGEYDAGAEVSFFTRKGAELASSQAFEQSGEIPPEVRQASLEARSLGQAVRGNKLYVAVPGDDVVVRLAASMDRIYETMHVLRRDMVLVSLFAVALATLLGAFLAHRGTARHKRIVTFASRIAAGDFSARVQEGNLDEIS